jgi:FG-GAP-like repeat/Abnormal spindle-like microcephaly-assoc'd, ASPM-SPD-2-Hydin
MKPSPNFLRGILRFAFGETPRVFSQTRQGRGFRKRGRASHSIGRALFVVALLVLAVGVALAGHGGQSVAASASVVAQSSTSLNGPGNVFLTANLFSSGGNGTVFVAVADFNGDGKLDYVTANDGNNTTTMGAALGNGDGTFKSPVTIAIACGAVWVATGDFNGDGKTDLAVASRDCNPGTNGVSIFLGNGDGTFTAKGTLTSPLSSPASIAVGDFNGDGKLDLAVVDRGASTDSVFFYFGNGDGTFQAPTQVSLGVSAAANQIVAADFNKDGHLDVAVSEINGSNIVVILGAAGGKFQAPRTIALPAQGWGIAVGDFNGDGIPDLVATSPAIGGVSVFLGKGDGNFNPVNNPLTGTLPTATAAVPGGGAQPIAVGDFNKDGKLDIIAGLSGVNTAACVAVLLGNGDGTFNPETLFVTADTPQSLAVGDFNGDGDLDWIASTGQINSANQGSVTVALGRGDGTFLATRAYVAGQSPGWAAVADFDKDGKLDVVVTNAGSQNSSLFLGSGDGTLQPAMTIATVPGLTPNFVVTGDFNNDGNPDFVEYSSQCPGNTNSTVWTFLGKGDGTFQAPTSSTLGPCHSLNNMVAGDFNGDGKLDLAMLLDGQSGAPLVAVMLGNGDGTFQAPKLTSAPGSRATWMSVGDLNKDGKLDVVVVQYGSNALQVFLGNGDGTFQSPTSLVTGRLPGSTVLGDFNGDGNLDIFVENQQDVNAEIYLGIGDGTFLAPSIVNIQPTNSPASVKVVGDFNLDGHLDVLFGHNDNRGTGISLLLGNGDGTFQPVQNYLVSGFSYVVATADFNRDGAPDALLVDPNEEFISILLNQTPPPLNVSPKGLTFSNQNVGTTSATKPVTVTNNGTKAATVGVAVTGDFAQTNTCPVSPATLAASASCTINVSFTPTTTGLRTGTITITDSLPGSPQVFPLSGTGVVPIVTLGGTSLSFGNQIVGMSSPVRMVSLSNTGTGPLTISSIGITGANSGDFSQTNTCPLSPSTLAPQANCAISVTFKPTATGTRSASVSITDNAAGSPHSVSLSGAGIAPVVSFGGTSTLTFSGQPLGSSSSPQSVTLTNTGNAPLTISSIAITGANSGDFSQTNTCPASSSTLAAGANCTISVTFKPTATGTRNASLNVADDAAGSPQSVSLIGTGTSVPGDFDGDGKADVAVWRPSNGVWFVIPSSNPTHFIIQQWGTSGDMLVRGDYDGDGKTDFAVWRPSTGTWFIIPSNNPSAPIVKQWGTNGDIPVPGDYDGDGKTDFAVWRPSTGTWFIIPSSNPSAPIVKQWGTNGDIPVPGDYDGDGKTDFAVWRPSNGTWYIIPSSNPGSPIIKQWGTSGDIPVPADYDADRKADMAVWRPSNGVWFIIPSSAPSTFTITQWGINGDVPVQKPIGQ